MPSQQLFVKYYIGEIELGDVDAVLDADEKPCAWMVHTASHTRTPNPALEYNRFQSFEDAERELLGLLPGLARQFVTAVHKDGSEYRLTF